MDEVATRAGLSRSTMYFYFASKADLLAGLLARTHDEIVGPAAILLDAGTAPDRAVRQELEALLRTWRQHGPALRTFLETGLFRPRSAPDGGQQRTKSLMSQHRSSTVSKPLGASPRGPPRRRRGGTVATAAHWSGRRLGSESVPSATPSALTPVAIQLRTVAATPAI